MKLEILNRPLLIKKLAMLVGCLAVLVPLVHFELVLPSYLYVSALLALHVYIFVVYLYRVEWRKFSRTSIISRIVAVIFFAYLLKSLSYSNPATLYMNIFLAFVLHITILLCLMVRMVKPVAPAEGA